MILKRDEGGFPKLSTGLARIFCILRTVCKCLFKGLLVQGIMLLIVRHVSEACDKYLLLL